jgi:hypothetical protein
MGDAFDLPGGPAFPVSIPGAGDNGAHGMSLRDWFAGMAVSGVLVGARNATILAQEAYKLADAMLAERKRTKP